MPNEVSDGGKVESSARGSHLHCYSGSFYKFQFVSACVVGNNGLDYDLAATPY